MNTRFMTIIIILSSLVCGIPASADVRNLYYRMDLASGNVYNFAIQTLATSFGNYLTNSLVFDNSMEYTVYNGKCNFQKYQTKPNNMLGLTSRDLFNDEDIGARLGYRSDNFGNVNWGLYGSFHYKINQLQIKGITSSEYEHQRLSFLKPGVGTFFTFGSIEHKTKFQIEVEMQYCMPTSQKGIFGDGTQDINKGMSTRYAFNVGGAKDFKFGIYANLYHFNLLKNDTQGNLRMNTIGLTMTITPHRGRIYD